MVRSIDRSLMMSCMLKHKSIHDYARNVRTARRANIMTHTQCSTVGIGSSVVADQKGTGPARARVRALPLPAVLRLDRTTVATEHTIEERFLGAHI